MNTTTRTTAQQHRLSSHMRRKDVLEYALWQSMQAQPATPEELERFLATAPPEVFVLIEGLTTQVPTGASVPREDMVDHRIVQGLVGSILNKGARR